MAERRTNQEKSYSSVTGASSTPPESSASVPQADNVGNNQWVCTFCGMANDDALISCKRCFTERSIEHVRRCRNELLDYIKREGNKFTVTADPKHAIICIGDVHGNLEGLKQLFINLEEEVTYTQGKEAFEKALIVFLGDYVDRGPDSCGVIQFLIDLPKVYPQQKHIFLMGNHDHQFTALIEALPEPQGGFTKYSETEFASDDEVDPEFVKDMLHIHPKGRRYAAKMQRLCGKNGGYDVYMTAVSYGCTSGKRNELLPLVPQSHIDFLKNLSYICLINIPGHGKLLCLHGGFLTNYPTLPQLKQLVERDPDLLEIEQMYQLTRNFTIIMPPADLFAVNDVVTVSGHHGIQALDKNLRRIIIDPGDVNGSCGAVIFLPSLTDRERGRLRKSASPSSFGSGSSSPSSLLADSPVHSPCQSPVRALAPPADRPLAPPLAVPMLLLGAAHAPPNSEGGVDLAHDDFPLLSEHIKFYTDFHQKLVEARVEAARQSHLSADRMRTIFGPPPTATATLQLSRLLENTMVVRSTYEEALMYTSLITLLHDLVKLKAEKALRKKKRREAEALSKQKSTEAARQQERQKHEPEQQTNEQQGLKLQQYRQQSNHSNNKSNNKM